MYIPLIGLNQYTLITDKNFEKTLKDLGYDNTIDGKVKTENICSVKHLNINVHWAKITDLTGLEGFTSLTELHVLGDHDMGSELTVINISNNKALELFYYDYHYDVLIENIDLSNNVNLRILSCDFSALKSLDISNNVNLQELYVPGNNLTILEVSKNTSLTVIDCGSNHKLTSLDVSQNTLLRELDVNYNKIKAINVNNNKLLKILS